MKRCLIFILTCLPISLYGQNDIKFENLTVEDGLSYNLVFEIIQDQQGFVWFGTIDGLNRYDGHEFAVFRNKYGDTTSLPDNSVWALHEDRSGVLWVGTDGGGLSRFDREKEQFTSFKHDEKEEESLSHNSVNAIYEDSQNNLWVATYGGGLNLMDRKTKTFKRFLHDESDSTSLSNNYVHFLFEDSNGDLWVGTKSGLNKYNRKSKSFVRYKSSNGLPHENILAIAEKNNSLWLGSWGSGLIEFDRDDQSFNSISVEGDWTDNRIAAVFRDSSDDLWTGFLGNGLSLIDSNRSTFRHDPADKYSLVNNNIWILAEDDQGNLWVGTEGGVSKISGNRKPFQFVGDNQGLKNAQVYDFEKDEAGHYWIATEGGLYYAESLKGKVKEFILDGAADRPDIWSITIDDENFLWVTTYGSGLYRINLNTNQYLQRQFAANSEDSVGLITENTSSVTQSADGSIWIGTYGGGLNKYDLTTDSFTDWYHGSDSLNPLAGDYILTLAEDSHGYIWVGTYGSGVSKINQETGKIVSYKSGQQGLQHNTILDIAEDKQGNIWLGTDGGGLAKYNRKDDSFDIISKDDGLPSNVINGLIEGDDGYLWLSTNAGIVKYKADSAVAKIYTAGDGLASSVFNSGAAFKDDLGQLFFGSGNGFNYFLPERIVDSKFSPPVYITDLKLLNKSVRPSDTTVLSKDIKLTEAITLTHQDRIVSFEFVALDYTNPQKLSYAYKLEGFDENWVTTDAENRSATYTNLNAGTYEFKVKATNSDGAWNEKEAKLAVTILPPPWLTWWAYTIYAIAVLLVIAAIIRVFVIRERLKSSIRLEQMEIEKMHELDRLKTKFFTNISHEFRTPLTLILTPLGQLLEKAKEPQIKSTLHIIKRNASRLLNLINELLDLSKLDAGHLRLAVARIDAKSFLQIIIASFESLAEGKHIQFSSDLSFSSEATYFDKEKLEKIVTNLLSNAMKFTPENGSVNFSALLESGELHIIIQNSGSEISAADQKKVFDRFFQTNEGAATKGGTGVGLALVKELVALHKGSIDLSSEDQHTSFAISFPISKEAYSNHELVEEEQPLKVEASLEKQTGDVAADTNMSEKPLVLVVEDNDDLRNYMKESLAMEYAVETAANGQEGQDKSRELIPDLIVSDLMMPEVDGLEMLKQVREDAKTDHIPVIMLTAKADIESRLTGIEKGADHYMTKPFEMHELLVRIKSLMEQRARVLEHYRVEFLTTPPESDKIASADDTFLQRLRDVFDDHLSDSGFSVDKFAHEMAMSRVQLHRKIKATIGLSTSEFMRQYRLKLAHRYLVAGKASVSEIAYEVGFNNLSYFAKSFKETFQINPSELLKSNK